MATIYDRRFNRSFTPPEDADGQVTSIRATVLAVTDTGYVLYDEDRLTIWRLAVADAAYAVGDVADIAYDEEDNEWKPRSSLATSSGDSGFVHRVTDPEVDEILGGWSKDDIVSSNYTKIAYRLANPRQIALTGDVLGDAYFDGSHDIQIGTAVERITNSQLEGLLK